METVPPLPKLDLDPDPDDTAAPWWKCVVAALPNLLLGLQFLVVAGTGKAFYFVTTHGLTAVMQAELVVLNSMAFLGLVGLYRPATTGRKVFRAVAFWGLFAAYVYMTLESGGLQQLVLFLSATFVTYLGLFLNWRSPSALLQLGARYIVCFVLFILVPHFFGAPGNVSTWSGLDSVLRAGAAYFLILGALELSGLYLRFIPRHARGFFAFVRGA